MSAFVLIGPLLELVTIGALHLLSRGSLDRALHGALLLQAFALQALLLVSGLMLGAAFGRLRSLAWLFAGLAATAMILLVDRVPRAAVLNPLTLLDWEWTSTGIRRRRRNGVRASSPPARSQPLSRGGVSCAPARPGGR